MSWLRWTLLVLHRVPLPCHLCFYLCTNYKWWRQTVSRSCYGNKITFKSDHKTVTFFYPCRVVFNVQQKSVNVCKLCWQRPCWTLLYVKRWLMVGMSLMQDDKLHILCEEIHTYIHTHFHTNPKHFRHIRLSMHSKASVARCVTLKGEWLSPWVYTRRI